MERKLTCNEAFVCYCFITLLIDEGFSTSGNYKVKKTSRVVFLQMEPMCTNVTNYKEQKIYNFKLNIWLLIKK